MEWLDSLNTWIEDQPFIGSLGVEFVASLILVVLTGILGAGRKERFAEFSRSNVIDLGVLAGAATAFGKGVAMTVDSESNQGPALIAIAIGFVAIFVGRGSRDPRSWFAIGFFLEGTGILGSATSGSASQGTALILIFSGMPLLAAGIGLAFSNFKIAAVGLITAGLALLALSGWLIFVDTPTNAWHIAAAAGSFSASPWIISIGQSSAKAAWP